MCKKFMLTQHSNNNLNLKIFVIMQIVILLYVIHFLREKISQEMTER